MQAGNTKFWSPFAENLQERIKMAVKRAGGATAVSEITGYSMGSVYNYMRLQSPPQLDFMYGLCAAARVRPEWLFLDELPISADEESGDWETGLDHVAIGEKRVPVRDIAASAGYGLSALDEDPVFWLTFPLPMLMNFGDPDQLDIIKVSGDSMVPELFDGDMAMIDRSQRMIADGLYVLLVDDRLFLKRVVVRGRSRVELVSANPAYPSFEVDIPDQDDEVAQDGHLSLARWCGSDALCAEGGPTPQVTFRLI